jgi:tripartite-type tricarboxylate transporter receptor subunit TctC
MEEAGYKIDLPTWLAMYSPKGTSAEAATKFGAAIAEIVARPDVNARIYTMGFFPMIHTPGELHAMNEREFESYEAWVKRANFKID